MVFKPDLIIEVCDDYLKEQGDSAQALFRFLEERGYRFCSLQDHQPLTAEYASANKILDMLAITGEK
jgi:hypothetical protein